MGPIKPNIALSQENFIPTFPGEPRRPYDIQNGEETVSAKPCKYTNNNGGTVCIHTNALCPGWGFTVDGNACEAQWFELGDGSYTFKNQFRRIKFFKDRYEV